ncbi:uncharacterized protein Z519_01975 [Cladophialophora bantiana CBS 173.52]|uniref:Uncharacterized protein n=1 Tax=Cladophialophora bantiana (strain ATCC 10958 / CBS 173.52 / CDC B-1940 / NIH 8579) TaxID=1442370 RepID=A0A0D2IIK8_CLAB1|nr:uncharacterized protein Z519_01975 [Cladophialophora bantiana CBS 173.52]KIW96584.1 hypothetical protein Z519_01975 [Cladophialophora bantiana CBS 173.52]
MAPDQENTSSPVATREAVDEKGRIMVPPIRAPETAQEQNLPATKNEFMNPYATKIPKESILALFPNEETWKTASAAARRNSRFHKNNIMVQILYLSCLKNCVLPELIQRGNLLAQGPFPFSTMPQVINDNQRAWISWAVSLDETIANALKQLNWLELLEKEYESAKSLWTSFWPLHQEEERQKAHCPLTDQVMPPCATLAELEVIYKKLAGHNQRRLFLQTKMVQGRDWMARLFEMVPPWIEWEEVVREMLSAGMGGQPKGNEAVREPEGGFLENVEDEEQFDL